MELAVNLYFGSISRSAVFTDHERYRETNLRDEGGRGTEHGKGRGWKTIKEVVEDREATDLFAM